MSLGGTMFRFLIAISFLLTINAEAFAQSRRRVQQQQETYPTTAVRSGNKVGPLIFENDLYAVHEPASGYFCGRVDAWVSIVFKVDPDYRIEDGPAYRQRLEKDVL